MCLLCIFIFTSVASSCFFLFLDPSTTEFYTLSYTTLFRSPVLTTRSCRVFLRPAKSGSPSFVLKVSAQSLSRLLDRKSTRLNSSHLVISYAVFCLKKKNQLHLEHTYK